MDGSQKERVENGRKERVEGMLGRQGWKARSERKDREEWIVVTETRERYTVT